LPRTTSPVASKGSQVVGWKHYSGLKRKHDK